jgi:uncharacterized protein DUF4350
MSNRKPVIIVVVVIAALTGIYFFLEKEFGAKYNWYETYEQESTEPYGTYTISGLLKSYYPHYTFTSIKKPLEEELQKRKDTCRVNYIFIGDDMYVDSNDVQTLLDFVEKGNNAFIAAKYSPFEMMDHFYYNDSLESSCILFPRQLDSTGRLNFFQSSLQGKYEYSFMHHNLVYPYRWKYLKPDSCTAEDKTLYKLGYLSNEKINYFKIDHGRGSIYFHTTPLAFTNYFLLKPAGVEYASKVFSFLPPGNIIWDEYSKIPSDDSNYNPGLTKSPLKFILSEESLRWAWYIFLVLIFMYLIFGMKRRQKIIPLVLPKVNTSLDYINTVGLMFFQHDAHRIISLYKMKMFLAFIRSRYFIPTNTINDELKKRIAENSSISQEDVEKIFLEFALIGASHEISKKELITFHNLLTAFYKKCK